MTTNQIIIPGTAPTGGTILGADGAPIVHVDTTPAAPVGTTGRHGKLPVAVGPDTVGAIVTHAGSWIVPADKNGVATCPDCITELPVDKFPTRPSNAAGIVTRNFARCRDCRDIRARCNKIGAPYVTAADRAAAADAPPADRWDAAGDMTHVVESAAVTDAAIAAAMDTYAGSVA